MDEMTPRQRMLALLDGKSADRVPTDYWAVGELTDRLKTELDCADDDAFFRHLHIDRIRSFWPRWKSWKHPEDPEADPWGFRMQTVSYGAGEYGEYMNQPLAHIGSAAEMEAWRWPSPDDLDYAPVDEALSRDAGHYLRQGGAYEPFLQYCQLRGMEQAFLDLLMEPAIAEAGLAKLFEFHYEQNRRIFEAAQGRLDVFYLAEDLGSQTGPLMSLDSYRRFIRPNQVKMAELARSNGLRIFYHTDGAARAFLPDLVDVVGIDILNPIQYVCAGMEREGLVRDFGGRVVFHGGIENQRILPLGTPEEVAREVRENFECFRNARWICAPCHNLQAITPTANVLALYETMHEIGGA